MMNTPRDEIGRQACFVERQTTLPFNTRVLKGGLPFNGLDRCRMPCLIANVISDYEQNCSLSVTSKVEHRSEIVTTFGLTRQSCLFSMR